MKILLCHNYYQLAGGEDQVFADETNLLRENGHEVLHYTRHNDDVDAMSHREKIQAMLWNSRTYQELRELIQTEAPDVMHCTNTFPLISPAAYAAAREAGVGVVQSIHNYRLMCPNALFLREGKVCEDCLGKSFAWPAVRHACYRESRLASAAVAFYQWHHRRRGTWVNDVDLFVALTDFSRDALIAGGIPAEKITVKTNFIHPDPGLGDGQGGYALFVGRLSEEKGVQTLIRAWQTHGDGLPELRIIGGGPLEQTVSDAASQVEKLTYLGKQPLDEVYRNLDQASCLIVPSLWYEVCPKTILEAYAKGTPVVGSRLGGMSELIDEGRTGRLFSVGDAAALATAVRSLPANPSEQQNLRAQVRREYETKYTPERNYELLMQIYDRVTSPKGASPVDV